MYKCAICEKEHSNITDRAKCELNCAKRIEDEAKKAAEAKKLAEKNNRQAEVDAAFDYAYRLRDEFLKDYDSYTYSKTLGNSREPFFSLDWLL